MDETSFLKGPVTIVAIGAGNRANKYLEYAVRHPERLRPVGVVEPNPLRRKALADKFGITPEHCFADYASFFGHPLTADAVLIATPENEHFKPCMMAIEAGYHVLLEKPIAQTLDECQQIADAARRKGVIVGVCHVLRYHPYFIRIKQIVDSGELGSMISISHKAAVGIDRMTHGYVRGLWRREELSNPILISKCCHDIDFLLWLTAARCRRLSSFGSLRWFRTENAPAGCAKRCIECAIESSCPYSAVDLYRTRRDWISNFDIPEGLDIGQVIDRELRSGPYGRCVFHCDNDVVDHQILAMEMENDVTISFTMDAFTRNDRRETHIRFSLGEIDGDERQLRIRRFRGNREEIINFSEFLNMPFHAGADLNLIEDFVETIACKEHTFRTSIEQSLESHRICHEAERSRLTGQTVLLTE